MAGRCWLATVGATPTPACRLPYPTKPRAQDEDSQLQFWKIVLCDPASYTPGAQEAAALAAGVGAGNKTLDRYAIQRNLIVRWGACGWADGYAAAGR